MPYPEYSLWFYSNSIKPHYFGGNRKDAELALKQWAGGYRYILAGKATINTVPVTKETWEATLLIIGEN